MENSAARRPIGSSYAFVREAAMPFDEAVTRTRQALQEEGFGVLSEIRMDDKFKEKLGVEFRKYLILGACNPPLAYRTVQHDINIGLLLPCNVVVYEGDDFERSVIAAIDAEAMMSVVGEAPEITEVAAEVNDKLRRAVERV